MGDDLKQGIVRTNLIQMKHQGRLSVDVDDRMWSVGVLMHGVEDLLGSLFQQTAVLPAGNAAV